MFVHEFRFTTFNGFRSSKPHAMKNHAVRVLIIILVPFILLTSCKKDKSSEGVLYKLAIQENFPCVDGLADATFPCENVGMFAHLTPQELGGSRVNDIWGWTDPVTGKEYALVGLYDGISFVDLSDPNNPVVVGKLEEASFAAKVAPDKTEEFFPACMYTIGDSPAAKDVTMGATWRDVKVFDNHAFVVSDGQIHGMQVFDLTHLRDYNGSFLNFSEDAFYDKLGNAHNIAINEQSGFAYAVGVTTAELCGSRDGSGLHIIDINNPKNPQFAGCAIDEETDVASSPNIAPGYIHDTQCVNYEGPDKTHFGKEICVSSAEGAVVITDVTDKQNPKTIGFSGQTEMQYSHQGWLTEDHRYFLMDDEVDEINLGRNTKTYVWDLAELDNPTFVGHYTHETPTIDHNLYVRYNYVFQSNYTAGLRVLKTGDLSKAELTPFAYFDTQPTDESANFRGTWSNYPYFDSGVVIASDIYDGLFILKPDF